MKLSIIIPCYNEDRTIRGVLEQIFEVQFPINREIIIVDDGSDTNQSTQIKDFIDKNLVKFFRLKQNHGKGFAIRIGLQRSTGDMILIQDADLEYQPKDILRLLSPIMKKEAKVVFGTRFDSNSIKMSKSHYFGNKLLTRITNLLYGSKITDMETGYKLFSKDILKSIHLNSREFEFEPEFTSKVLLGGYKIIEVPISFHYRKYDETKINVFDGIESLIVLFQNRFFQNSKFFDYFYRIYKFHMKKILTKISNKFKNYL